MEYDTGKGPKDNSIIFIILLKYSPIFYLMTEGSSSEFNKKIKISSEKDFEMSPYTGGSDLGIGGTNKTIYKLLVDVNEEQNSDLPYEFKELKEEKVTKNFLHH